MSYFNFTQKITPLIDAVQNQDVEAVKDSISSQAALRDVDSYGQTCLHWAAKEKSAEIVCILIDAGADIDAQDGDNDTPLLNAIRNSNLEIAEILTRSGAKLNLKNKHGESPLELAKVMKNEILIKGLTNGWKTCATPVLNCSDSKESNKYSWWRRLFSRSTSDNDNSRNSIPIRKIKTESSYSLTVDRCKSL